MGVNKVDLANGETLIDLQNDTVTPQTLAKGETAHNKKGERIVGTMVTGEGGSGGSSGGVIMWVTSEINLATMTVSNMSHTYDEIVTALDEGKIIKIMVAYRQPAKPQNIGYVYGDLVENLLDILRFQIMLQADLGSGNQLFYFAMRLNNSNTVTVSPYIVNTTDLGG